MTTAISISLSLSICISKERLMWNNACLKFPGQRDILLPFTRFEMKVCFQSYTSRINVIQSIWEYYLNMFRYFSVISTSLNIWVVMATKIYPQFCISASQFRLALTSNERYSKEIGFSCFFIITLSIEIIQFINRCYKTVIFITPQL